MRCNNTGAKWISRGFLAEYQSVVTQTGHLGAVAAETLAPHKREY